VSAMKKPSEIISRLRNLNLDEIDKRKLRNLLIILSISILLFSLSLYLKNQASLWFWEEQSEHGPGYFYWTNYNDSEVLEVWYLEAYGDASYYYEPYLLAFKYENWNPYAGGNYEDDPLHGYAYGPLFIFGLYFLSLFVGLFNPGMERSMVVYQSVKWTHIAFDSLCVVLIYLIIINFNSFKEKNVKKHTLGFLGGVIFLFMPINLLYVDSVFLNTPQMCFFTLLSYFLFMKNKYKTSAFFLSIAWLSKQMPLFLLIPWFLIIWKKDSLKEALLDFVVPFVITTFILSLAWIFISPVSYAWRVFGPGKPLNFVDLDHPRHTVTLAHSFLFLGSQGLASFYAIINSYMIPFIIFYALACFISYFNGKIIGENESYFTILTTWIIINTHLFISRGVYKYYNAFITPFIVLSILVFFDDSILKLKLKIPRIRKKTTDDNNTKKQENKKTLILHQNKSIALALLISFFLITSGLFYYYNWILITNSRFLHPLYLLILFVLISLFFPPVVYGSFTKKNNYIMIKEDVVYILKQLKSGFITVKEKIFRKPKSIW
jgi:hypothetical protein